MYDRQRRRLHTDRSSQGEPDVAGANADRLAVRARGRIRMQVASRWSVAEACALHYCLGDSVVTQQAMRVRGVHVQLVESIGAPGEICNVVAMRIGFQKSTRGFSVPGRFFKLQLHQPVSRVARCMECRTMQEFLAGTRLPQNSRRGCLVGFGAIKPKTGKRISPSPTEPPSPTNLSRTGSLKT